MMTRETLETIVVQANKLFDELVASCRVYNISEVKGPVIATLVQEAIRNEEIRNTLLKHKDSE